MDWQIVVALLVAVPVIIIPVAFIWFFNIGGVMTAIKDARAKRAAKKKEAAAITIKGMTEQR